MAAGEIARGTLVVAQSTASADTAIKAARSDIARFEAQAKGMRPGASGAKRTLKLLKLTEGRLNGSRNKSHPSWIETQIRLQALKARLTALAAGKTPGAARAAAPAKQAPAPAKSAQPAAPKQAAPAAGGGPADPNVERAARELKLIDRQIADLRPNDRKTGMRFHKDLGRIAKALNAAPDKKHLVWRATVKDYRRINTHIVTTLMQGINAELDQVAKRQDDMSELDLLSKSKSDRAKAELGRTWTAAAALGAPKHPDVKSFIETFKAMEARLNQRINAAIAQHEKLGDVRARVAEIDKRQKTFRVPQPLRDPITEDAVKAYAARIKTVKAESQKDLAYLQRINGKTPLVSSKVMGRLLHWVGAKPADADKSAAQSTQTIDAWVETSMGQADFLATTDINDSGHVANRLLGGERPQSTLKEMDDGLARVKTAAAFDAAME